MLDNAFEALKNFDWGTDLGALAPIEDAAVAGLRILLPQNRSTHGRNSISQVHAERGCRRTLR